MIKNVLKRIKNLVHYIISRLKRLPIHIEPIENSSIKIGPHTNISKTVMLEIKNGGTISIGSNTELLDYTLFMTYGGNIEIGNFCSINPFTIVYGHGNTKIGNYVMIAGNCMVIPNSHTFDDLEIPISLQKCTSLGITIEDDVWIAANCTILDGVTIGTGSVIGAGSVVNKSIPPFSIAVGVPAKVIKSRKSKL